MRITVVGVGYLGATHAACMARLGHDVVGLDVDEERLAALGAGQLPFHEPGLTDVLREGIASGRLRFTTSAEEAGAHGDVVFVCVGTPQRTDSDAADLTALHAVVDDLVPHLRTGTLLVGKSTVPVGTAQDLAARVRRLRPSRDEADPHVEVAWNPEFLREGHAVEDTLAPYRLVFGVESVAADKALREVYSETLDAGTPLVVCDLPTAEMVKVAANAFLATKISFVNAMAELCDASGADVGMLADAIGYDPRIGRQYLDAGLGFGGGCLPKDIRGFIARAEELDADQTVTFLREVDAINMRQRQRMVELAVAECGGDVLGQRIAVLGAAFKPNSDDVRDSPALNVAAQLELRGAHVRVHDPEAIPNARRMYPMLTYTSSLVDAVRGAHLVLHLTEWPLYRETDPEEIGSLVARRRVLDGRNCLDVTRWRSAGWSYRALGRPTLTP